jgi:hypothetical protein
MTKFEDFGKAIDEEFQRQKDHIQYLEDAIDKLNYDLSHEKMKRLEVAKRLREFASWLEVEE